jgi:hypothetical protein
MSGDGHTPTERSLSAFTEKLGEFRGTLPRDEQQVLDTIMATACAAQSDVTGFQHRRPYIELQYDPGYQLPAVYLWSLYEKVVARDVREAETPNRERSERS